MKLNFHATKVTNTYVLVNYQKVGEAYPHFLGLDMSMTFSGARTR